MLSLKKLESLLSTNSLIIQQIYTQHKICKYIEVVSTKTSDIFMIYIKSKYSIKLDEEQSHKEVMLTELDIEDVDYVESLDDVRINNDYERFENDKDIEEYLKQTYDYKIELKDISYQTASDIKRQIKRINTCLTNLKYEIIIIQDNVFCSTIKNDDDVISYKINNGKSKRRFILSIDLNNFVNDTPGITEEIKNIRIGIYKILTNTTKENTRKLEELIERKNMMDITAETTAQIDKMTGMLKYLQDTMGSISGVEHSYHNDDSRMEHIGKLKYDIIKNYNDIKEMVDELTLVYDEIIFDNAIMIDRIFKNIKKIKKILSSYK